MGRLARLAGVLALLAASGVPPAAGQADLGRALVGRWEGALGNLVGVRDPANPHRTLVIDAVEPRDGRPTARGQFGISGGPLGPVAIDIDTSGARPTLKFTSPAGFAVRLDLLDDRHLNGTFTPSMGAGPRDLARTFKLEKAP